MRGNYFDNHREETKKYYIKNKFLFILTHSIAVRKKIKENISIHLIDSVGAVEVVVGVGPKRALVGEIEGATVGGAVETFVCLTELETLQWKPSKDKHSVEQYEESLV